MDFFDNVSRVINETARKAAKASGDMLDYTKLMISIRSEKMKIESFYREMGRSIYKKYRASSGSVPADIVDYCECIDEINATIATLRERAAKLRGENTCHRCGAIVGAKFEFCPSCGVKQPKREAPAAEPVSNEEDDANAGSFHRESHFEANVTDDGRACEGGGCYAFGAEDAHAAGESCDCGEGCCSDEDDESCCCCTDEADIPDIADDTEESCPCEGGGCNSFGSDSNN